MKRADLAALAKSVLSGDYRGAVLGFIGASPQHIARQSQISLLLPYPADAEILQDLAAEKKVGQLGETIMGQDTRQQFSKKIVEVVSRMLVEGNTNAGAPGEGIAMETARVNLGPKLDRLGFQALIDEEINAGKLLRQGDKLALPGRESASPVDSATARLQEQVLALLNENFCMDLNEIAKACQSDINKAKAIVQNLAKQTGRIQLINYEFAITQQNLDRAHQILSDIWNVKRNIAPSEFREQLNTTRKYAMALLQHFDDTKVTRRLQDGRVLLKPPRPKSGSS
jgi:selenocysteine-specific elongation factor